MEIIVKDSFGNECDLGDVIIRHSPHGRNKYLGILTVAFDNYELVISDGDKDMVAFKVITWMKFERICNIKDAPELDKYLGMNELNSDKKYNAFIKMIEDIKEKNQ